MSLFPTLTCRPTLPQTLVFAALLGSSIAQAQIDTQTLRPLFERGQVPTREQLLSTDPWRCFYLDSDQTIRSHDQRFEVRNGDLITLSWGMDNPRPAFRSENNSLLLTEDGTNYRAGLAVRYLEQDGAPRLIVEQSVQLTEAEDRSSEGRRATTPSLVLPGFEANLYSVCVPDSRLTRFLTRSSTSSQPSND